MCGLDGGPGPWARDREKRRPKHSKGVPTLKKRTSAFWLMMGLWTSGTIAGGPSAARAGWQVGTARAAITPGQSMWMSGYSARTRPSEGAVHDLWAKAVALQD